MRIEVSKEAVAFIEKKRTSPKEKLSLLYEPIGCQCSLDAVFVLCLSERRPKEVTGTVISNIGEIWLDESKRRFLDEKTKIVFNEREQHLELRGEMMGLITQDLRLIGEVKK